ncbi:hypothetical protein ASE65_04445 [Sphingomonas sp. Leaf16]|nr:hypothetical protein ASE65_04445 [Sphingomonas sp. Leaf16]KQN13664.1 hypothetical protein ASE81_04515 [Sphingomonas sp. Leaf29]KQN23105.1 hypothetical protein ASE83_00895 [Sphingomonas sp. Leaf32]
MMTIELFDYRDADTLLQAGVAFPEGEGQAPAVLIVHQWAGRGEGEHKTAERLAELGFVGIAMDMFGKDVKGDPSGDNSHLIGPFLSNRAALLQRVRAAVAFAAPLDRVDASRIAVIGYCFGGLCALDLARGGADGVLGVVSLHGMLDGNDLAPDGPIAAKVLVEHGWRDPLAAPDKVLAFAGEMAARDADWQLHAHGRAMHAFTNTHAAALDKGMAYDADADRRSWESVTAFLAELF